MEILKLIWNCFFSGYSC